MQSKVFGKWLDWVMKLKSQWVGELPWYEEALESRLAFFLPCRATVRTSLCYARAGTHQSLLILAFCPWLPSLQHHEKLSFIVQAPSTWYCLQQPRPIKAKLWAQICPAPDTHSPISEERAVCCVSTTRDCRREGLSLFWNKTLGPNSLYQRMFCLLLLKTLALDSSNLSELDSYLVPEYSILKGADYPQDASQVWLREQGSLMEVHQGLPVHFSFCSNEKTHPKVKWGAINIDQDTSWLSTCLLLYI